MKKLSNYEMIVKLLSDWGCNEGDFTDLVVMLARNQGFADIEVRKNDDESVLFYDYRLSEKGEIIADEWAKKNGFQAWKVVDSFEDYDLDSVENSLADFRSWGMDI